MEDEKRFRIKQGLNAWHSMFYDIYGLRNSERDAMKLFSHLVEVAGGFSKIVRKSPRSTEAVSFVGKVLAWYCALAMRLGYRDLESVVWQKYPQICPYCGNAGCACNPGARGAILPNSTLRRFQHENRHLRPVILSDWQSMFSRIYGASREVLDNHPFKVKDSAAHLLVSISRLCEELGELAEAIRLEHVFPIAVTSELADVFAWLMSIANLMPAYLEDPSFSLEENLWNQYPGECTYCYKKQCICPNDRVRQSLVASAGNGDSESIVDTLTGLQRKDVFQRSLAEHVAKATDRNPLSLIMIDLDRFKQVNDGWGHLFGDEVLAEAAHAIKRAASAHSGFAFRWGGEEFAVVLPNRSREEALAFAERLRRDIKTSFMDTPDGKKHCQTISCGISTLAYPPSGSVAALAREFLRQADVAVYQAKEAGRDKCCVAEWNSDSAEVR